MGKCSAIRIERVGEDRTVFDECQGVKVEMWVAV